MRLTQGAIAAKPGRLLEAASITGTRSPEREKKSVKIAESGLGPAWRCAL